MKTWKDIAAALNEEIPSTLIEPASQQAGIYGRWMRGHAVMQLANKIFGPDGWTSYIISPPKVEERIVAISQGGAERMGVLVTCIVQITARGLDENDEVVEVTKQDIGWGTAAQSWQGNQYQPLKPQQMRPALMGAITIGFKRCFHQFGRHLGMELYLPDEDVIALGWEEGEAPAEATAKQAPARRPTAAHSPDEGEYFGAPATTEPPPTERKRPSAGDAAPPSTTVEKLAAELGIEVTDENQRALVALGARELRMRQAGSVTVRTKKVKDNFETDKGASVADVYAQMASYAVWMASEVDKGGKVSNTFENMDTYMKLARITSDTRYHLQGGTYEPWPGVTICNPTTMVGFAIEKNAIRSLTKEMGGRFEGGDEEAYSTFHLRKHLEKHFGVERLGLLTWEQLAAFRLHVTEGAEYPQQWSGGDEGIGEALAGIPSAAEEPAPVLTEEDIEAGNAALAEAIAQIPEDDVDYTDQCTELLIEIQGQVEYEGDLPAFAAKQGDLSLKSVFKAIGAIHKAVGQGNIQDAKTLEVFLTTALKGLTQ